MHLSMANHRMGGWAGVGILTQNRGGDSTLYMIKIG